MQNSKLVLAALAASLVVSCTDQDCEPNDYQNGKCDTGSSSHTYVAPHGGAYYGGYYYSPGQTYVVYRNPYNYSGGGRSYGGGYYGGGGYSSSGGEDASSAHGSFGSAGVSAAGD